MPSAKLCEDSTKDGNTIFGMIADLQGRSVSHVKLVLSWTIVQLVSDGRRIIAGQQGKSIEIEPDGSGHYVICGLPLGVEYRIHLQVGERTLEKKYIAGNRRPDITEINFSVASKDSNVPKSGVAIVGTVFAEGIPKQPLQHAEIWLSDSRALTDEHGNFRFVGVVPGSYNVRIRSPGYQEQLHTLDVDGRDSVTTTFVLRRSRDSTSRTDRR